MQSFMKKLPTVVLDTTLRNLYLHAGLPFETHRLAHVYNALTSSCDITPTVPMNKKYVYLDTSFLNKGTSNEDTKRQLAIKMLSLIPQRDGFISGASKVLCFHTGESVNHDQREFSRTMGVLRTEQRPLSIFCDGPEGFPSLAKKHGITTVTSKMLIDDVVRATQVPDSCLRLLGDPDKHWFLNTKAALARSGLPTPSAEVLEIDRLDHSSEDEYGREDWTNRNMNSILSAIGKRSLPFVVKSNQAFSGSETWLIHSEQNRIDLLVELSSSSSSSSSSSKLLQRLLATITPSNQHLEIGTFLLTDMILDPISSNFGLTFFINVDGTPVFLGVCEQIIDSSCSGWMGNTIVYSAQERLRGKVSGHMHQIAVWLHSHGYVGPVGADILESRKGEMSIVDLNVRSTGSMCLPLLRSHFVERGLDAASCFSIDVGETREGFVRKWESEFLKGAFVIVGWYEESDSHSLGFIVVGAEDEMKLGEVMARVMTGCKSVKF